MPKQSTIQSGTTAPTEPTLPRVLCVDDESIILEVLEIHLSRDFDVYLATSGKKGLEILKAHGPFAVVISDMQMPEMDGATFLKNAREISPDAIRVLLTGRADVDSSIKAVNQGNIFRFLRKPCPPEELIPAVRAAVRQHELIISERVLLEQTLTGTVKMMTEVMSLTTPVAFRRTAPLKSYVNHMCDELQIESRWDFELAATLAQVGCITLPPNILEKYESDQSLNDQEQKLLDGHPAIGRRLLSNIPRLERVAKIVGSQNTATLWSGTVAESNEKSMIYLGANMLAVARAFDKQILNRQNTKQSCEKLKKDAGLNTTLISAMESFGGNYSQEIKCSLKLRELQPTMLLDQDIVTASGQRILVEGCELTAPILERLYNFSNGVGIEEPIKVCIRH